MEIDRIALLDKPLTSYAIAAAILLGAFVIRLLLLRVVKRRKAAVGGCGESRRDGILEVVISRLAVPSLYIGSLLAIMILLNIVDGARQAIGKVLIGLGTFFGARLIISIMGLYATHYREKNDDSNHRLRIRPILGFLKAIVWLLAGLFFLDNLGVKISAVMAGLGIGGIAVALAAQSILGDLFGYFIIFFDRPFEVGDFILFEEFTGTVEQIGMKTTKVRALTGEQIVVANSVLTNTRIRNYKRMEQRRVVFEVGVAYDTSRELLAAIPDIVRNAIEAQPLTEFDRSHLKGFGPSSLNFENVYHVTTADYAVFMDTQQAVMLRLLSDFASRGIEIAYPTTKVFMAGDGERASFHAE